MDTTTLRLEVGGEPGNLDARTLLARQAFEQGRPGEALRELLFVRERRSLPNSDARLLSRLLLRRGEARLAVGDSGALSDLRVAKELGALVDTKSMSGSYALCAVAALRHSSEFRQTEAKACLTAMDANAVHRRWDQLDGLALAELEALWDWFSAAGAKRRALEVAQGYVNQGGQDAKRLERWRTLHEWWFGSNRPLLPEQAAAMAGPPRTPLERFAEELTQQFSERSARPETLAKDWGVTEWQGDLTDIIRGYQDDPALADRRARRFVDASVYSASKAAFASELFHRLGDPGRARDWAQELAVAAPGLPAAVEAAGHAHAVSGQPERAGVFYTAAAAASGDGGATWARAARAYRMGGQPLAAVAAGRRALGLTAKGWDMLLLFELQISQATLGRQEQAAKTREALWNRFPDAERSAARTLVKGLSNATGPGRFSSLLGPIRSQLGFAESATAR